MKVLIPHYFVWIISLVFSQQDIWYTTSSTAWNSIIHQMKFRQPVTFTPFEVKMGYLNYGGNNYWASFPYNSNSILISDFPILLDSTQYNFEIINSIKSRSGLYIEADVLKTNFPNFIFHQNYIDLQFGLGLQYIDFSSNPSLPTTPGKEWDVKSSRVN